MLLRRKRQGDHRHCHENKHVPPPFRHQYCQRHTLLGVFSAPSKAGGDVVGAASSPSNKCIIGMLLLLLLLLVVVVMPTTPVGEVAIFPFLHFGSWPPPSADMISVEDLAARPPPPPPPSPPSPLSSLLNTGIYVSMSVGAVVTGALATPLPLLQPLCPDPLGSGPGLMGMPPLALGPLAPAHHTPAMPFIDNHSYRELVLGEHTSSSSSSADSPFFMGGGNITTTTTTITSDVRGPVRIAVLVSDLSDNTITRRLDGLLVALDAANRRAALGPYRSFARPLIIYNVSITTIAGTIRNMTTGPYACANITAFYGLIHLKELQAAIPALEATNTTIFYSYDMISDLAIESPNVVFTRPSSLLYAHAMVHAVVVLRQLRRVVIATTDDRIGLEVAAAIKVLLADFEIQPLQTIAFPDATLAASDAILDSMLLYPDGSGGATTTTSTKPPQAVLLFIETTLAGPFEDLLARMFRRSNGTETRYLFNSRITTRVANVVRGFAAAGAPLVNGSMRLVSIQPVPHASLGLDGNDGSTSDFNALSRRFREEYATATGVSVAVASSLSLNATNTTSNTNTNITPLSLLLSDSPFSLMAVNAWVDGSIMIEVLSTMVGGNTSRTRVSDAALGDKIFSVENLWFGLYSKACGKFSESEDLGIGDTTTGTTSSGDDEDTTTSASTCFCNIGGRELFLTNMDVITATLAPAESPYKSVYKTGLQKCHLHDERVASPILVYRPHIVQAFLGANAAYEAGLFVSPQSRLREIYAALDVLQVSATTVANDDEIRSAELANVARNRFVSLLLGGYSHLPINTSSTAFTSTSNSVAVGSTITTTATATLAMVDVDTLLPRLGTSFGFQRNVLHLQPFLEHEMMAAAAYIFLIAATTTTSTSSSSGTSSSADADLRLQQSQQNRQFKDISSSRFVHLVVADSDGGNAASRSHPAQNFSSARNRPLGQGGFDEMRRVFQASLETYLIPFNSAIFFPFRPSGSGSAASSSSALSQWLQSTIVSPPDSHVFLIGLTSSPYDQEVTALATFLTRNPRAVVFLPFHTVQHHYEALLQALPPHLSASSSGGSSLRERVLFVTSLPRWTVNVTVGCPFINTSRVARAYRTALRTRPTDVPLSVVEDGLTAFPEAPLTMRGHLARALVEQLYSESVDNLGEPLSSATLLTTAYKSSVIAVDSVFRFGPFSDASCALSASTAQNSLVSLCESNNNRRFSLRVERLSVATGERNSSALSDSYTTAIVLPLTYRPLPPAPVPPSFLQTTQGLAIVVAGAVVVAAGLLSIFPLLSCYRQYRTDRCAPQDSSVPFTLMFTDIQSSTALWAELPERMGPAIDAHHAIIRRLIEQYNGYEVKTVGDAFMIAFKHARDAVALGFALEFAFFQHEWGTDEIDQCLREVEQEALAEATDGDGSEEESDVDGDVAEAPKGTHNGDISSTADAGENLGAQQFFLNRAEHHHRTGPVGPAAEEELMVVSLSSSTGANRLVGSSTSGPPGVVQPRMDPVNKNKEKDDVANPKRSTKEDQHEHQQQPMFSSMLPLAVYRQRWRGLRVRVGIHTGFGTVKRDEINGRFDYYGTVANTAARIEAAAHGGQVLISADTLAAWEAEDPTLSLPLEEMSDHHRRLHEEQQQQLPPPQSPPTQQQQHVPPPLGLQHTCEATTAVTATLLNVGKPSSSGTAAAVTAATDMSATLAAVTVTGADGDLVAASSIVGGVVLSRGEVQLKGLPAPIHLLEVPTVPGRVFPPLRVDVEVEEDYTEDDCSDTSTRNGTTMDPNASTNTRLTSASNQHRHGSMSSGGSGTSSRIPHNPFTSGGRTKQLVTDITIAFLRTLFSPLARKGRLASLEDLCKKWRVRPRALPVTARLIEFEQQSTAMKDAQLLLSPATEKEGNGPRRHRRRSSAASSSSRGSDVSGRHSAPHYDRSSPLHDRDMADSGITEGGADAGGHSSAPFSAAPRTSALLQVPPSSRGGGRPHQQQRQQQQQQQPYPSANSTRSTSGAPSDPLHDRQNKNATTSSVVRGEGGPSSVAAGATVSAATNSGGGGDRTRNASGGSGISGGGGAPLLAGEAAVERFVYALAPRLSKVFAKRLPLHVQKAIQHRQSHATMLAPQQQQQEQGNTTTRPPRAPAAAASPVPSQTTSRRGTGLFGNSFNWNSSSNTTIVTAPNPPPAITTTTTTTTRRSKTAVVVVSHSPMAASSSSGRASSPAAATSSGGHLPPAGTSSPPALASLLPFQVSSGSHSSHPTSMGRYNSSSSGGSAAAAVSSSADPDPAGGVVAESTTVPFAGAEACVEEKKRESVSIPQAATMGATTKAPPSSLFLMSKPALDDSSCTDGSAAQDDDGADRHSQSRKDPSCVHRDTAPPSFSQAHSSHSHESRREDAESSKDNHHHNPNPPSPAPPSPGTTIVQPSESIQSRLSGNATAATGDGTNTTTCSTADDVVVALSASACGDSVLRSQYRR